MLELIFLENKHTILQGVQKLSSTLPSRSAKPVYEFDHFQWEFEAHIHGFWTTHEGYLTRLAQQVGAIRTT